MSAKGMAAGIVIAVVVLVGVGIYTNVFQVARPGIESSINYTKDLVSKVQGNDVVSKAEQITSDVKSVTSQIKVQNPLEPKK